MSETCLSMLLQVVVFGGFNLCVWCCWCCSCGRPLVYVVNVDGAFIFVGDGNGISQADSDLQCRMRICARVEELSLGCRARDLLDSFGSARRSFSPWC